MTEERSIKALKYTQSKNTKPRCNSNRNYSIFFIYFPSSITKNINFSQKTSLFNNNNYYILTRLA